MNVLALDPGPEETAWAHLNESCECLLHGKANNSAVFGFLDHSEDVPDVLAVEMIASYGMPVGREVFETCVWIGRFIQAWRGKHVLVYRRDVKLHLCGSPNAKDSNIRQAIIDRYPRTGGGKVPQIGTKSKPGPLYGFAKDQWAALGVALTYMDNPKKFKPLGEGQ